MVSPRNEDSLLDTPASGVRLRVRSNHLMLELVGEHDAHLRMLEKAYSDVQIIVRGNEILISGESDRAAEVRTVAEELLILVQEGEGLDAERVDRVIQMVREDHGVDDGHALDMLLESLVRADLFKRTQSVGGSYRAGARYSFAQPLLKRIMAHQLGQQGVWRQWQSRAQRFERQYHAQKGTLEVYLERVNRQPLMSSGGLRGEQTSGSKAQRPSLEPDG